MDQTVGNIYKVQARNFRWAVYLGNNGFAGIREKFGFRYIFVEYDYNIGPPFGTVKVIEDTGDSIPDDCELKGPAYQDLFEFLEKYLKGK